MAYGVDLGNSTLKVVALERRLRGVTLAGAARRRAPKPGKPEERKPVLMKLLFEALGGAGGKRPGVIGLSGRDINLQVVQQPAMKPVNYRAMMGYELEQRRGTADDLYADYCTLREPDAYFHQFLAMVGVGKRGYVDDRIEIGRRAGVDLRDAVPNSFALFAAHRSAYGVEGGTVVVLDIGADSMDMALIRGGRLIYARNISSGARLFDTNIAGMAGCSVEEAEWLKIRFGSLLPPADNADPKEEEVRPAVRTAAGQLAGFIQASLNHGKNELGDRELVVDKMYVAGGGSRVRGLLEYLQGSLKLPVEPFDPFRNLDTAAVEKMGVDELRALPTDLAVPIGLAHLALSPGQYATLSILPDEVKKRRNFLRTTSYLGAGAAALLLALAVWTVAAFARKSSLGASRERLEKEASAHLARIARIEEIDAQQRDVAAKIDQLAGATLSSKALLDVHSEIRDYAQKEEGLMLREMRVVDPAGENKGRRRCLFTHAEFPLVIGEIEESNDETIRVRMDYPAQPEPRTFAKADCAGMAEWDADVRVVVVVGEVAADAPGKANRILEEMKRRLTKPQRGQAARTSGLTDSDRMGWRKFEIVVFCQPRYE